MYIIHSTDMFTHAFFPKDQQLSKVQNGVRNAV